MSLQTTLKSLWEKRAQPVLAKIRGSQSALDAGVADPVLPNAPVAPADDSAMEPWRIKALEDWRSKAQNSWQEAKAAARTNLHDNAVFSAQFAKEEVEGYFAEQWVAGHPDKTYEDCPGMTEEDKARLYRELLGEDPDAFIISELKIHTQDRLARALYLAKNEDREFARLERSQLYELLEEHCGGQDVQVFIRDTLGLPAKTEGLPAKTEGLPEFWVWKKMHIDEPAAVAAAPEVPGMG